MKKIRTKKKPIQKNKLPKPPRKPSKNHLDKLWSEKVKKRVGNKCEYCGKVPYLNSHHIFSRSNHAVRWDLDNGVALCAGHHVFGNFSAHKSPVEFVEWIKAKRGIEWYERLRAKASKIVKADYLAIEMYLNEYK